MGYGKEIHTRAQLELSSRRQRAYTDAEIRRERIYAEMPRVKELEAELTKTGVAAARAVLAGGDTKSELIRLRDKNLSTQNEISTILAEKGYTTADLEERWFCPMCKDKGYVDGRICSCLKKLLRDIAFSELNGRSPLSLETSRFDTFSLEWYSDSPDQSGKIPRRRMENILHYCQSYADNFSKESVTILMDGSTGLGKTHLSLAIAGRVIEKGFGVIYGTAPDLLSELETEHFSGNHERDIENRLINCDLLIIDDLGTEFSKSFTKAAIYNLINSRLSRHNPTIINTNLTVGELKKEYSDRLISRLLGDNEQLTFIGEDVRIAKKRKRRSEDI